MLQSANQAMQNKSHPYLIVNNSSAETNSYSVADTNEAAPQSVQAPPSSLHKAVEHSDMSDNPTRPEIDAKLAAVEARIDAKLSGIAADIKIMSSEMKGIIGAVSDSRREVKEENNSTRRTMVWTAIAIFVALAATVWQMQSTLLTAFQTGLTANQFSAPPASTSLPPANVTPVTPTVPPPAPTKKP